MTKSEWDRQIHQFHLEISANYRCAELLISRDEMPQPFYSSKMNYHSVKRDIDVLCYVFVKAKYEDMSSLDRQHPLH